MNPPDVFESDAMIAGVGDCPSCGSTAVTEEWMDDSFQYGEGKSAVVLSAKIPMCHCSACDFTFTDWRTEELQNNAVCAHLDIQTPREIIDTRALHDFSQQGFAELSRIGRASLAR